MWHTVGCILTEHESIPINAGLEAGDLVSMEISAPWWSSAVGYEIYVRSFKDSNGDGSGDLNGITEKLDYIKSLGVDLIWISPFFDSPLVDGGYDVSDFKGVHPELGSESDFRRLVQRAHALDLRVIIDLVPNHTSSEHIWFKQAVDGANGGQFRNMYWFAKGVSADQPPNNWQSVFGGSAWSRLAEDQWYLHTFDPAQPDLNWTSPLVRQEFVSIVNHWLGLGVDGFRLDVAHGMAKPEGLPDAPMDSLAASSNLRIGGIVPYDRGSGDRRFDNEGVHDVLRFLKSAVRRLGDDKVLLGELWVFDIDRFALYMRPGELDLAFSFRLLASTFSIDGLRSAIDLEMHAAAVSGKFPLWVLANHDVSRPVTRYGGGKVGHRRARSMLMLELALPGSVFLYYGEELGLPDGPVPVDSIRDPRWVRSQFTEPGRDGARLPMPWNSTEDNLGFTRASEPWLPISPTYIDLTVDSQEHCEESFLAFTRRTISLRKSLGLGRAGGMTWLDFGPDVLAFQRDNGVVCVVNLSAKSIDLSESDCVLSSDSHRDPSFVAPDSAVWMYRRESAHHPTRPER